MNFRIRFAFSSAHGPQILLSVINVPDIFFRTQKIPIILQLLNYILSGYFRSTIVYIFVQRCVTTYSWLTYRLLSKPYSSRSQKIRLHKTRQETRFRVYSIRWYLKKNRSKNSILIFVHDRLEWFRGISCNFVSLFRSGIEYYNKFP